MTYDKLLVATSPAWVAEDLRAAGTIEVGHTIGLDAPALDGSTALWCSWTWAMRLARTGIQHPFLSPGPDWLTRVPEEFLRRKVWAGRVGDMPYQGIEPTFYKLAEHKHSGIPAGLHIGRGHFQRLVGRTFDFAPDYQDLHYVGSERMAYAREYRCFITHGKVTASSFYLSTVPGIHGTDVTITWDAFEPDRCPESSAAAAFAEEVVEVMGADQPPGYVLDVGEDTQGNWSVIEANAAWSSNIYHAAPATGVVESILASQEPGHPEWDWAPDTLFLNRARPLPSR
ncbi:ATP-grasp domain-containing protein [Pseudarthrobacter sp. BIM B-2242]|uniref:ATP-grasp domain-containing protein n=1 Tax=Pseudarthrobacter sp. BIM B-2242 TaxID=2772401 RepID=UPI00168C0FAD|nr:ATP-grasp domain-containing protein [Pseudarthrobacter sp. BIM B-2242]QOD05996.1 ATP-grasp domain-containing protein [Pseudarthrobacter sp. BIM B-2242]